MERDYLYIPDDPMAAFLQMEAEFRNEYYAARQDDTSSITDDAVKYFISVATAAEELEIQEVFSQIPHLDDSTQNEVYASFIELIKIVDAYRVRARIRLSRHSKSLSVGLTDSQKKKIHAYIQKIRDEVSGSNASNAKKEQIFEIISKLSLEIDRQRTPYDRFADLARGLSGVSKEVAQTAAEPWWKWFAALMGVVDEAKQNDPVLPGPEERKRIEGPRKQLPPPASEDGQIPF